MENPPQPHVVIIPTPGMGHLIPLVQLATRLIRCHRLTVSFLIPTTSPPSSTQLAALSPLPEEFSDYTFLPPVILDDAPPDTRAETRISLTLSRSLPAIKSRLAKLATTRRLTALVTDLFGTDAFDVGREFGLWPYIFYSTTAMCLSFFLHLPELDGQFSGEFRDMVEPVKLPGCVPVHGRELIDPVQDRKNDAYKWVLHHTRRYRLAEGILVNTFSELEKGALEFLQQGERGLPPVYQVGPLVQTGLGSEERDDGSDCLRWLDEQPCGSVLYVSFGSGGTLSHAQLLELAHGLEMSEQRFLWVVRRPNNKVANATYFNSSSQDEKDDPLDFLPKGFLDRTQGRGLVVLNWAPQMKVLSHSSTAGFLTHCGWNSILESVVCGVPMVAWPLYAEQRMNAVMLTEDLKVALKPKADESGLIGRGEIARVVRGLMVGEEGKGIRNKMKDLKDAAARTLCENGSSAKALSEVVLKWKSH